MTNCLRTKLLRNPAAVIALLAVLLCAQFADSLHQVDHASTNAGDMTLCHTLHSPMTTLSFNTGLSLPTPTPADVIENYLAPALGVAAKHFAAIRAPPATPQL